MGQSTERKTDGPVVETDTANAIADTVAELCVKCAEELLKTVGTSPLTDDEWKQNASHKISECVIDSVDAIKRIIENAGH